MQLQGKLMNQTRENGKNPSFGSDFGPNLAANFFFKYGLAITRYHGQLSSCTISEKNNDPTLQIIIKMGLVFNG